jgi:zinc/manganese transport system substrate-binding protein
MRRLVHWLLRSGLSLALLGACLTPAMAAEPLRVAATFSLLGDLVKRIGGDAVALTVLVGSDGDVHAFEPGAEDQRRLAEADLLVANGLGLEPWLERMIESSGFKGRLVVASDGIEALASIGAGSDLDPHAFQDPANGAIYAANIAAALAETNPGEAQNFQTAGDRLVADMNELNAELAGKFAAIPKERRRVLTSHDAFQYFGRAYGIDFVAIQGQNPLIEPSARDFARLVDQARAQAIPAIFLENMVNPTLAESLAQETGIRLGGTLQADALSGPDGPAPDYLSLIRHNAALLLAALAPDSP